VEEISFLVGVFAAIWFHSCPHVGQMLNTAVPHEPQKRTVSFNLMPHSAQNFAIFS
jgi:hypothetical protein